MTGAAGASCRGGPGTPAPDPATDTGRPGAVVSGQAAVDGLIALLDLERLEVDLFRGRSPEVSMQRVFGGQVAGQALVAAGRTMRESTQADMLVHSLHAYFLLPGDPSVPIVYQVDRIRDGRSFATRRVVALQHGRAIFNLSASFQRPEEASVEHGDPMPDVPPPDSLPTFDEMSAQLAEGGDPWAALPRPIDRRYVEGRPWERTGQPHAESRSLLWIRADGTLPDDPFLHVCTLTFASDMTLLDAALVHHGLSLSAGSIRAASLDHAMWFHRPFRADEWLVYEGVSPSASGGRGFCLGRIWSQDGRHVATVAQEGMIRRARDRRSS